jgi:hypothetical protein
MCRKENTHYHECECPKGKERPTVTEVSAMTKPRPREGMYVVKTVRVYGRVQERVHIS